MELQIVKIENYGKKITLSDQSVWEVFYPDSPKSKRWLPTHTVIMTPRDEMNPYKIRTKTIFPYTTIMENVDSDNMVGAKPYTRS